MAQFCIPYDWLVWPSLMVRMFGFGQFYCFVCRSCYLSVECKVFWNLSEG
jgi:hypothetical protein